MYISLPPTDDSISPSPTQSAPSFRHLEGRAVSAAFLKKFAAEKVTREIETRATKAAIPYLKAQISRRQQDVKELVATQKTAAVDDSEGEGKRHAINLTNANRWLGWLQEDLAKRKAKPYVTARDVHRYIIKPETEEQQCRYCNLPGLAEEKDPESGMCYFGLAQHFFSYNWDSPFEVVVDAICTHSESEVAEGRPPPYYWVDNFAINQHERTSEEGARRHLENPDGEDSWRMSRVACDPCESCVAKNAWAVCSQCPCVACRERSEDLPDWGCLEAAVVEESEFLGFERVIRHTRSTLMLMEPWHRPRAPTRVWCLYEANLTLLCGGHLVALLGSQQESDLQLQLNESFSEIEQVVSSLNSRTADATGEDDKIKIFGAIETLPGGYDALDEKVQIALRDWLAEAAQGVIRRTDPARPRMTAEELQAEARKHGAFVMRVTQFIDWWPGFHELLFLVAGSMTVFSYGVIFPQMDGEWRGRSLTLLSFLVPVVALIMLKCSSMLEEHQRKHLLRIVPLFSGAKWLLRLQVSDGFMLNYGITAVFLISTLYFGIPFWFGISFWMLVAMLIEVMENGPQGVILRHDLMEKVGWLVLQRDPATALQYFEAVKTAFESQLGCCSYKALSATIGCLRALHQCDRHDDAATLASWSLEQIDKALRYPHYAINQCCLSTGGYPCLWISRGIEPLGTIRRCDYLYLRAAVLAADDRPDADVLSSLKAAVDHGLLPSEKSAGVDDAPRRFVQDNLAFAAITQRSDEEYATTGVVTQLGILEDRLNRNYKKRWRLKWMRRLVFGVGIVCLLPSCGPPLCRGQAMNVTNS